MNFEKKYLKWNDFHDDVLVRAKDELIYTWVSFNYELIRKLIIKLINLFPKDKIKNIFLIFQYPLHLMEFFHLKNIFYTTIIYITKLILTKD